MKNVTILRFLTAVGSAVSTVAVLDLAGVANMLEPTSAKYLLAAGPAALALKELVVVLGDWFDDGKPNKSFKVGVFCFALMLLTLPLLASCSTLTSIDGTFTHKDGRVTVHPDGSFEVVIDPKPSK